MKIAIPDSFGEVNPHFGQSKNFTILKIDSNKQVKKVENVSAVGLQHMHFELAGLLKGAGVEVVIAGGIGQGAIEALEKVGLTVFFGATGSVTAVAEAFATGEFVPKTTICGCKGHRSNH